jgi:hypothetical protein
MSNENFLINVAGLNLSPAQYRHMFDDLAAAFQENDHLGPLDHYTHHGRPELEKGLRTASNDRVNEIRLQQMSISMPDLTPSGYFKLVRRPGRTLDICFSYTFMPLGRFNFEEFDSTNSTLYINMSDNDFYQRGIPGISSSIDETVVWLKRVIEFLDARIVRTFGGSAGGYAAALFGSLLDADAVYAFGPLLDIGRPHCRSYQWNASRVFDHRYKNIIPFLRPIVNQCVFVFPTFSIFEFRQIAQMECFGLDRVHFSKEFHPGGLTLDFHKIMRSREPVGFTDGIFLEPSCHFRYSFKDMAKAECADEALWRRDHATANELFSELLAIDPENHGMRYLAGVEAALADDGERATELLTAVMRTIPLLAFRTDRASFKKSWRQRVLEDFGPVTSSEQQRRVLAIVEELWISQNKDKNHLGEQL